MIETVIAVVIVVCATVYWYARLFPRGWRWLRGAIGLPVAIPSESAGGCGSCSGCKVSCKSHH